jgi:HK97 family phage major capsid protein
MGLKAGNRVDTAAAKAEHKALDKFIRTGDESEIKSMSVGSDPDGGYTVMPVMSDSMTTRLFDQSPMRKICRVETITAGDAFEELDDRDEPDATRVGETESRPATETPQLGKWRIPVEEIYALQPVTQRLLDDTSRDLGGWIEGKVTDKFGRSEGTAFISGDGVKKPRGLLNYTAVTTADATRTAGQIQYVKTGGASGFAASNQADALKTLMWTLRTPYRTGAVWMMNSSTAAAVDKFKESTTNAYIWRNGMQLGEPAALLGYPVVINEDMPDLGSNTFPIAFGNFKLAYCIVEKRGIKWLRDPFTNKPNVLHYAYKRVGGGLANDDAVKLLKCES